MDAYDLKKEIVRISHLFYHRGWSLATSSNYSARLSSDTLLITASGKDKGLLTEADILTIGMDGVVRGESTDRPSAEAWLHCELYRFQPRTGAILHTHSVFATVLTSMPELRSPITLGGYEMLKALEGVSTHTHKEHIPVFQNDQNMQSLARSVLKNLEMNPRVHGFLIAGHGLYCWGKNLAEALKQIEAFEFLLECEYRKIVLSRTP